MKNKMFRLFTLCMVSCLTMGVGAQKPVVKGVKGAKNASKAVKARISSFKPKVNVPAVVAHEARKANKAYSQTKKKAVNQLVLPDVRPHVPRAVSPKAPQLGKLSSMLSANALHVLDSVRREKCIRRFVSYAKINSQCADIGEANALELNSGQRLMAEIIEQELKLLAKDNKNMQVVRSESGYVYVKFPATTKKKPSIMFVAHLDVAPGATDGSVRPMVHRRYQGGDIKLPSGVVLSPNAPQGRHMNDCVGKTIITSDGTTPLGADGKSGCTVLVSLIDGVAALKSFDHGDLCFVFSQNETIGKAAERFEPQYACDNPDVVIDVDGDVPDGFMVENATASIVMHLALADIIKNAYAASGKKVVLCSGRGGKLRAGSVTKGLRGNACVFGGQQAGRSVYEWTCVEDMIDMANILYGVIAQVSM